MTTVFTGATLVSDWLKEEISQELCRQNVTILSGQDLPSGTVLGLITGTTNYTKCNTAAGDGSQAAKGILVNAVDATGVYATGDTGAGNTLVEYTAAYPGVQGNNVSIALVDPGANSQSLAVSIAGDVNTGYTVTASLATDAGGLITTTSGDLTAPFALLVAPDTGLPVVYAADSGNDTDVLAADTVTLTGGVAYAHSNEGVMVTRDCVVTPDELTYTGTFATIQTALEALGFKFGVQ
jgi:hypothetical protein